MIISTKNEITIVLQDEEIEDFKQLLEFALEKHKSYPVEQRWEDQAKHLLKYCRGE